MSEERLKGSATLKRTINLGNYSSLSVEASEQFFLDETNHRAALDLLDEQMLKWLEVRGIKNEVKAIVK